MLVWTKWWFKYETFTLLGNMQTLTNTRSCEKLPTISYSMSHTRLNQSDMWTFREKSNALLMNMHSSLSLMTQDRYKVLSANGQNTTRDSNN